MKSKILNKDKKCEVEGCNKPVKSKNKCGTCYSIEYNRLNKGVHKPRGRKKKNSVDESYKTMGFFAWDNASEIL